MRILLLLLFLSIANCLAAQSYKSRIHYKVELGDTSQLHQIILLDYTKLLGLATKIQGDSIYFRVRSAAEESIIPIRELRYLGVFVASDSPGKERQSFYGTPAFTDLTYERTALPLKGKGQVRVINLIYGVAEWNINENLQLGAGLGGPLGVLFTQKLRFSLTPDLHVGLTGQEMWAPLVFSFDGGTTILGDISAVVTIGNDRRFANLGTGILFNTDDDDSPVRSHRFGLGGQVGERWHIYGEFLMATGSDRRFSNLSLFPSLNASLGIRRHRWKFGVFTIFLDEDSFFPPPLPYVGYSYYW